MPLKRAMLAITSAVLLVPLVTSSCGTETTIAAENSTEAARASLRQTIKSTSAALPDASDWEKLAIGVFPGSNGWTGLENLQTKWKSVRDTDQAELWRYTLCRGTDPLSLTFDAKHSEMLRDAIDQTEPLQKAAAGLLAYSVLTPNSPASLVSTDTLTLLDLFMFLQNRVLALVSLGYEASQISDELRIVCGLAARLDIRCLHDGILTTSTIRIRAILTLLAVVQRSSTTARDTLFELAGAIADCKVGTLRARLMLVLAGYLAHANAQLEKSDEELSKDFPKRGGESNAEQLVGLFDWWGVRISALQAMVQKVKQTTDIQSSLDDARQLVEVMETFKENDAGAVRKSAKAIVASMILDRIGIEFELIHLAVRKAEASTKLIPIGEDLNSIVAKYPGFDAISTESGLVVQLAENHPYSRLVVDGRKPPSRRIEPWWK